MPILRRDQFTHKYQHIQLDLRDATLQKRLQNAGFNEADIHALKRKDGHQLVYLSGRLSEVSTALRDGKIGAEEAYLYLEDKDANGTWNSVNSDNSNNPNQDELAKRIQALTQVFQQQLQSNQAATAHAAEMQMPKLAELSLSEANEFFNRYPEMRYNRPLAESQYTLNAAKAQALFSDPDIKTAADLLSKKIQIGEHWQSVLTHVCSEEDIRLIAYRNTWQSKQKDLLRFIQAGEWYLGTSHHNPEHRYVSRTAMQDSQQGVELLKFNISHVRNYIGVRDRHNQASTVAIDSPRSYAVQKGAGHASKKDYPFLLWRIRFLGDVSHAEQRAYINNVRTWSMLFNKVTKFPPDYNGNDNLMTHTMERVLEFAQQVLNALLGSQADLNDLHSRAKQVYCSESGMHLALNLGLNIPLNKATIEKELGASMWRKIELLLTQGKEFWRNGAHQDYYGNGSDGYVQYSSHNRQVEMEAAPDWLQPLKDKLSQRNLSQGGLAFRPWNRADMIEHFIKTLVPREKHETWDIANAQADLLNWAKLSIFHSMGVDQQHPAPPALLQLFDRLITKLRNNYASYSEFRHAISIELRMANDLSVSDNDNGASAFVPPHMAISIKGDADEMIALEAVGQCFHEDLLIQK